MAAELKADGTHTRATKKGEKSRVFGRPKSSGLPEYTDRLPDLTEALDKIPGDFQIIGETVVYDENGRTWFEGSQIRCSTQNPTKIPIKAAKYPVVFLAFDVIELEGKNLEGLPYLKRKEILFELLENTEQDRVKPLPHVIEGKRELYDELVAKGEEGLILKRVNSTYQHTRSRDWLKIKKWDTERLKVVGYTPGKIGGKRDRLGVFGALILAKLEDDGSLVYRGKVGSGFNDSELKSIQKLLDKHKTDTKVVITDEDFTPVDVPLEISVKFFEETKNGVLRMPSVLKDDRGKNVIYYESTIMGSPQKAPQQTNLAQLLADIRKRNNL
jgi:bifunctional non-homologous end joining protein LigD